VGQLAWRLVAPNPAAAVEMGARFNNEFIDCDLSGDFAAGHDLQALGIDGSVEAAADKNPLGQNPALHVTGFADDDFCLGVDVALDPAVNMQVIV